MNDSARLYNSTLYHDALPATAPFLAFADYDAIPFVRFPDIPLFKTWTVIDGRYSGPMRDERTTGDFDYVEIIEATDTNSTGIRTWGSDRYYRECFDKSGASKVPCRPNAAVS